MPGKALSPKAFTKNKHVERIRHEKDIDIKSDPLLNTAWQSLQLHWLSSVPGYREEVKQRVSEAAIKAERLSNRFDNELEKLYPDGFLPRCDD